MKHVVVAPAAERDLDMIFAHIARDNPVAAHAWIDRLQAISRTIGRFPKIGRLRKEVSPDTRIRTVGDYLILYRDRVDQVEILRYVHGARRLDAIRDHPD